MPPFPSPTKTWHSTAYPSIYPSRPELSQKNKTILITGGGTGIGAGTAHAFAEAGAARIALLVRREQPLLDTKASIQQQYPSVEVFTASVDVTKADGSMPLSKLLCLWHQDKRSTLSSAMLQFEDNGQLRHSQRSGIS